MNNGGASVSAEDTYTAELIRSEQNHFPLRRSAHPTARQDSINWILQVHDYYRFNPATAMLAVNYLDRFLSASNLPDESGAWAFQLLAVASLSLAAKMEEPEVPLLLDLQLFDPKFVFEAKTIQRMEVMVMATLNWRLRSVTPFHFLHHFISKLPHSSSAEYVSRIQSISSRIALATVRVPDFMEYPPSAIAAASVVAAAGEGVAVPESYCDQVNQERVKSCHQLISDLLIDTDPEEDSLRAPRGDMSPPPSPIGVLEAAPFPDNPDVASQAEQQPNKRARSSL